MPFTFRARQKLVATFVVIGLILFIVTIILIGRGSYIFKFKDTYYSILNESYGFTSGSPIKYKGINIGKVKSVKLLSDETVRVDFFVLREYRNLIRENCVMKVQPTLLGSANFVLIEPSERSYRTIEPGNRVLSSDDIEGIAILEKFDKTMQKKEDLTATAKKILDNIDSLKPVINQTMYNVKEVTDSLKVLVNNLKELSFEISSTNNTIGSIIKDRKTLINKIDGLLATVDTTLRNVRDLSGKVQDIPSDIKSTMVLLQENLVESKKVLLGIKNFLGGEKEKKENFTLGDREK